MHARFEIFLIQFKIFILVIILYTVSCRQAGNDYSMKYKGEYFFKISYVTF
jgi:hypothetical protein